MVSLGLLAGRVRTHGQEKGRRRWVETWMAGGLQGVSAVLHPAFDIPVGSILGPMLLEAFTGALDDGIGMASPSWGQYQTGQ